MNQGSIERSMRLELAPVDAKYWEGIDKTNAFLEEPGATLEEYRAMWNELVAPYRKLRNNILRKYLRRFTKLEKELRTYPQS
jgi:hypothetical protein